LLLFSIIVYLVLTVLVGFWASRNVKNTGDYMLAGRSLPMMLSASALFATWFGSETVFGASSQFLQGGLYAVMEDPFGASLCLFLLGFFFVRKLYGMQLLTLGDYFKVRYDRRTELIASIFLAPPYIGYIAAQLVAMGIVLNVVTQIPVWQGVVISSFIVTLYTYVGGMWAISITDFVQSVIIIVGMIVLAVVLANDAGGAGVVLRSVPPNTYKFLPDWDLKEIVTYIGAWSVLGLGSIPSQDVFQRAMSSSSARTAVWSCHIAGVLYLTVAMLPLFISLCIKHLYPDQITDDTQLALPSMVMLHTSMPIQILFFGALLSAILSTTSSAILAPAAICAENVAKPLSKHKFTDKQLLWITRLSVLIFSMLATIMACMRSNIYELVGESSILSMVSLFIPLTLGLYWKRSSSAGALCSMVIGIVTWIIFEVYESEWPSFVLAILASLAAMIAGSLLWPEKLKSA